MQEIIKEEFQSLYYALYQPSILISNNHTSPSNDKINPKLTCLLTQLSIKYNTSAKLPNMAAQIRQNLSILCEKTNPSSVLFTRRQ
jgi:hypothetical protein